MPTKAYQTVNQEAYVGPADGSAIHNLGQDCSAVNLPSTLALVRRVVLGSKVPTADVARVDYRVNIPRLRAGESDKYLAANPTGIFTLIRTDDLQAMLTSYVVGGVPLQAAAQGEIVSNLNIAPGGAVLRATAVKLAAAGAKNIAVGSGLAYVVALSVSGNKTVSRGSTDTSFTTAGIKFIGAGAAGNVSIPDGIGGWLLHSALSVGGTS